ncbi:hypothetical protein V6N12_069948 [Hibiscus sabdariffa]|uniref:Uncharacterized protein n=1 Tax=Hibiscus sabdariffa TaxID=183260 RepID=A0ABR2FFD1_9ROSI
MALSTWFVYSGASHHLSPDPASILDGTPYSGPGETTVCSCKSRPSPLQISSSAAIPLIQGAKKLWRNVHVPCNAVATSETSTDNALVADRRLVNDRVGENVATATLNGSARGQSESLTGAPDGLYVSPPSVAVVRSPSMVPEMSPARFDAPSMTDAHIPHESNIQATLQELPVTNNTDTQAVLQDVPVTHENESLRTDTKASGSELETVGWLGRGKPGTMEQRIIPDTYTESPEPGHCDPLCEEAPLLPKLRGYFAEFLRELSRAPSMGYFSAVAPGTRTLARGIFSTPSYPEKAGAPCVLEPITIFRLT